MKKISISQLEFLRKNPSQIARLLSEKNLLQANFGGRPKSVRWLDALGVFLESKNPEAAKQSLRDSFSNRKETKKNMDELNTLVNALNEFMVVFRRKGMKHLELRHRISIPLTNTIRISGWIWIITQSPSGRISGCFIRSNFADQDWKGEIQYPIVQKYLAEKYSVDYDQVDVGLIDFMTGTTNTIQYSHQEIMKYYYEFLEIGKIVTSVIE